MSAAAAAAPEIICLCSSSDDNDDDDDDNNDKEHETNHLCLSLQVKSAVPAIAAATHQETEEEALLFQEDPEDSIQEFESSSSSSSSTENDEEDPTTSVVTWRNRKPKKRQPQEQQQQQQPPHTRGIVPQATTSRKSSTTTTTPAHHETTSAPAPAAQSTTSRSVSTLTVVLPSSTQRTTTWISSSRTTKSAQTNDQTCDNGDDHDDDDSVVVVLADDEPPPRTTIGPKKKVTLPPPHLLSQPPHAQPHKKIPSSSNSSSSSSTRFFQSPRTTSFESNTTTTSPSATTTRRRVTQEESQQDDNDHDDDGDDDDSDEDSDDSILKCSSGLSSSSLLSFEKKAVASRSADVPSNRSDLGGGAADSHNDSHSSHRFTATPTIPTAAATSTTTTTPRGLAIPTIKNPYAKPKHPRTTTPITATSVAPFSIFSQGNNHSTTTSEDPDDENEPFVFPTLLDQGVSNPDLRAQYCLVFWKAARALSQQGSHQRMAMDQMCSRLTQLAVGNDDTPIRSPQEYCQRVSRSFNSVQKLQEVLTEYHQANTIRTPPTVGPSRTATWNPAQGPRRTFYTIPEATLVALLDYVTYHHYQAQQHSHTNNYSSTTRGGDTTTIPDHVLSLPESSFMPLSQLLNWIDDRLHSNIRTTFGGLRRKQEADHGVAYYLHPSTRSAEYHQVTKLAAMGYMKFRKKQGRTVVELLPPGCTKAQQVLFRTFPCPPGPYRTSAHRTVADVPPRFRGICLAVDRQEGGGPNHHLHDMCHKLDMQGLPYLVGSLSVGDYLFFYQSKLLLPWIVERKTVQDVAVSFEDGRWEHQKRRMYRAQYVFGYEASKMAYIIEGKQDKHLVTGDYVGHAKHGVTKDKWNEMIQNLESEGFEVLRTTSPENSMFELSRWAARILKEDVSLRQNAKYTYQEFKTLLLQIPKQVDFSRLAKDAKRRRIEREREEKDTVVILDDDEEKADDGEGDDNAMKQAKELDTPLQLTAPKQRYVSEPKIRMASQDSSMDGSFISPRDLSLGPAYQSDPTRNDVRRVSLTPGNRFLQRHQNRPSPTSLHPPSSKKIKTNPQPFAATPSPRDTGSTTSTSTVHPDYSKWTASALKDQCTKWGLAKSGTKDAIIARLLGPRRPDLLLERKASGNYTPDRHDIGANALLVGLLLHQCPRGQLDENFEGLTKDPLYVLAEGLEITKNPFSGGTTQTGPYHYDGWSNMANLLKGDPALVYQLKGRRFKLTTSGPIAGVPIAKAVHRWCHAHKKCSCEDLGYEYNEADWY